ncbi:hypothetical protein GCM10010411_94440 [Actinomadura fulvescens]|uniref:Uncharacterized protein n=1 Tax=Actinomadura fulvescens TaxID=46160 RepID=A0ABP6D9Z8_9ACTN
MLLAVGAVRLWSPDVSAAQDDPGQAPKTTSAEGGAAGAAPGGGPSPTTRAGRASDRPSPAASERGTPPKPKPGDPKPGTSPPKPAPKRVDLGPGRFSAYCQHLGWEWVEYRASPTPGAYCVMRKGQTMLLTTAQRDRGCQWRYNDPRARHYWKGKSNYCYTTR